MKVNYAKLEAGGLHSERKMLPVHAYGDLPVVKIADFEIPVNPLCINASAQPDGQVQVYVDNCDVEWVDGVAKSLIPADSSKKDKRILFCLDFSGPHDLQEALSARVRDVDVTLEGFGPEMFVSASDHVVMLQFKPEDVWQFTRSWLVKETANEGVFWVQMEQPCYLQHTGREIVMKMGTAEEVARISAQSMNATKDEESAPAPSTCTALVVTNQSKRKGTMKKPVHFDDIIGQEEAKAALWKVVRMFRRFDRLRQLDAEMPRGILLIGDGGNGKTMLGEALAEESGVAFMKVNSASLISAYPGESGKNVTKMFNDAKAKKAPTIIFLDEIDAVGAKRSSGSDNRLIDLINTLFVEMDNLANLEYPIILIGATNRPEVLDPNLVRAGRFERKVHVSNPKHGDIVRLLQHYSRNFRMDEDVDLAAVAKKIAGLPCSSSKNVCNEAALALFDADETGKLGLKVSQAMFLSAAKQEVREHIGTSKGKRFNATDDSIKLVDVIGQDAAKEDLRDVINYLRNPQAFIDAGARIPKGFIMVGGPGEGKTRTARAVAGEAEVPFFSISGSDFVEKFVGVGASRVRELFAEAKRNAPCIIFIDEIDAVAKKRKEGGEGNDEYEQTLNQLLVEMDGFDPQTEPVVILAATNRKDALDPAILRPGRLDREAEFHHPNVDDRIKLLQYYTRNKPLAKGVKLESFARNLFGFSAAQCEMVCNEAVLLMLRDGAKEISPSHLDRAIIRITMGAERKIGNVTKEELENTRVHEGGHALVGWFAGRNKIARITILPYGGSLGHVQPLNDDRSSMSDGQMFDRIAMLLAGRAATEIVLDEKDTGPSSDFRKAREVAYKMVTEYGMSTLGIVPEIKGVTRSEAEKASIEAAVKEIVDAEDKRCREIITEHRAELDKLVKALHKKETILGPEFEAMMSAKRTRRSRAKVKLAQVA
jgi:cell division protease FtsH